LVTIIALLVRINDVVAASFDLALLVASIPVEDVSIVADLDNIVAFFCGDDIVAASSERTSGVTAVSFDSVAIVALLIGFGSAVLASRLSTTGREKSERKQRESKPIAQLQRASVDLYFG
jgi:ribose 1,5-bisphosphokinase PhnN